MSDEPAPEKTTLLRLLTSNDHTEVLIERWADGTVGLKISALDACINEELTPHEALRLIVAMLPDVLAPDPARSKRARLLGSREEDET